MGSSCMWIIIFFLAFFLEKVLLICFNLLYVVMFLFLAKLYVVMLKLLCCVLLLKRSVPLFGIFIISSRGFPYFFFFFFFWIYVSWETKCWSLEHFLVFPSIIFYWHIWFKLFCCFYLYLLAREKVGAF